MNLFVNYFRLPNRSTCLNLAVARIIICLYLIWKLSTFPFGAMAEFPPQLLVSNNHAFLAALRFGHPALLIAEQSLAVVCLFFCAIGLWTGITSFLAGLLITHLAGLSFAFNADKTFLLPAYFLIFYGIYRDQDLLTLDRFRSLRKKSQEKLKILLGAPSNSAPLSTLKWLLLSMAAIYFFTGYAKIKITGWNFDWGSADSIRSCLLHDTIERGVVLSPFGRWLLDQSAVLGSIGATTLFLELSFLAVVLCRLPITFSVLGLLGMHVGILLSMRTNYLTDMGFVFTTFVAWDSLAVRLQRSGKLLVVYDAKCSFCARVLLLFRSADVSGGLRFIGSGHADAPSGYDYTSALYVFDAEGGVFRGYAAFAELFRYLGITRPLAWLMCLGPVEALGSRIYEWVAKNRGKISTCGI